MSDILIKVRGLVKDYRVKEGLFRSKRIRALNNVDLDIKRGETLGLVGESGCGKSTLGNLLLSLIPPTEGTILFDGVNLAELDKEELRQFRRQMQMIFQDPHGALDSRRKIGQLLEEPFLAHGITDEEEKARIIKELLDKIGLSEEFLERRSEELSGGQAQRIAIMAALLLQPKFIVADEPVSSLDMSIQGQILNLLKDLQEEYNLTMLFITHDLSVCHYMSDRIAVMYLGHIVEMGTADQIYYEHRHPYTDLLFSSLLTVEEDILDDAPYVEFSESQRNLVGCPFYERCPRRMEICEKNMPELTCFQDEHYIKCHLYTEKEEAQ